jgi:HD-like signal output (HDOD) protein
VAARIVAVANSVFYSRGAQCRSLKDAIMRLGLAEVRDVAFQAVAKTTIFRAPGFSDRMRELFEAAQAAGLFARRICQILKYQSESAYLCGLLHDMGEAIILGVAVPRSREKSPMTIIEKEALLEAVQLYHAQTGAMVSAMWGLPEMVRDAIMLHHTPERSTDPSQMAVVTAVADLMLTHVGFGVPKRTLKPLDEPLFYKLNLTPSDVEKLLAFAEEVYENRSALDPS